MDFQDAEVQLSAQRLRELMLWHGKDENNLPPAATLVNLSRDTVAAMSQLQQARTHLGELRAALSQLFWSCDSSAIRISLLAVLGAPPETTSLEEEPAQLSWSPAPNELPPSTATNSVGREAPSVQRAAG